MTEENGIINNIDTSTATTIMNGYTVQLLSALTEVGKAWGFESTNYKNSAISVSNWIIQLHLWANTGTQNPVTIKLLNEFQNSLETLSGRFANSDCIKETIS